jgi:NhaP-type Na+/H+ and K+/H+ antiporters
LYFKKVDRQLFLLASFKEHDNKRIMSIINNNHVLESLLTDNEHAMSEQQHHIEIVILAPFLMLAIGAFLRQTTKNLPIPYTLQLLILGSILGAFLRNNKWNDSFQKSFEILGNMDPHLMLHIFLPPLVFESAASLDWHIFTQSKSYMLILAGPGLVTASIMTGFTVFHLVNTTDRFSDALEYSECPNYAWSFPTSVLLGVIMSATDPVAVVALLKDLGCKDLLATTIEGESLLNDGTALVMYTILIKLVEGDSSDNVGDYLVTFVKMSIGGASFGIFFGFVVIQWLRMIFNDPMTEITTTLTAAYLCFFIAEYFLHVSGVLAVVCLGLYFGAIGRTSVSPEVAQFLEEFWQCLGYIGNTLIFVTAGTVIGYKLPVFPASEFAQMFAMYLVCALIRAIVITLIYILFKVLGADIEYGDQVIATW